MGWQLQKRSERLFSEGSRYFSVGNRRLWQLPEVSWQLVGKGGGCRSTWPPPVGWRQIAIRPSAIPRQQPNHCSANYKMLLHWMKITLLSIQRIDNGLFFSQNTGKKVCQHRTHRLLFPSCNRDGATRAAVFSTKQHSNREINSLLDSNNEILF